MLTVDGIAKPAYRAFQMLRGLPAALAPVDPILTHPITSGDAAAAAAAAAAADASSTARLHTTASTPASPGANSSAFDVGGWMGVYPNGSLTVVLVRFPPLNPVPRTAGSKEDDAREAVNVSVIIPSVYRCARPP